MSGTDRVPDGASYAGRRPSAGVINTTMDREAIDLLHKFCPDGGRRLTGAFLARLLYEHAARLAERQRVLDELAAPMTECDAIAS
jgi:hypothetical protein